MAEPGSGIAKLLDLAREDPTCIEKLEKLRRTITVMFTDIQGSTAYFEKYGDAAGLVMVHHCNDALRRIVQDHRGRVIKNIGDGGGPDGGRPARADPRRRHEESTHSRSHQLVP